MELAAMGCGGGHKLVLFLKVDKEKKCGRQVHQQLPATKAKRTEEVCQLLGVSIQLRLWFLCVFLCGPSRVVTLAPVGNRMLD